MYNTWQLSWQQGNHGNSQDKGQYTPHIDVGGEAERLSVRLSTLIGILQRAANDVEDLCVHMFTVTLKSSVSSTQEAAGWECRLYLVRRGFIPLLVVRTDL